MDYKDVLAALYIVAVIYAIIGLGAFTVLWNMGVRPDGRGYNTDTDICHSAGMEPYDLSLKAVDNATGARMVICQKGSEITIFPGG